MLRREKTLEAAQAEVAAAAPEAPADAPERRGRRAFPREWDNAAGAAELAREVLLLLREVQRELQAHHVAAKARRGDTMASVVVAAKVRLARILH